jgi:hypothetical protein
MILRRAWIAFWAALALAMAGCAAPGIAMTRTSAAEAPHCHDPCSDRPAKSQSGHVGAMTCVGCAVLPEPVRTGQSFQPVETLLFRPVAAGLFGRSTAPDPPPPRAA